MKSAPDHIECLSCGQYRPAPTTFNPECPSCGYLGWTFTSALSEGDRAWYAAMKLGCSPSVPLPRVAPAA
jgi:hypothetical protein